MTYTDEQMEEISRDPTRRIAAVWRIAQDARRMAASHRRRALTEPDERASLMLRANCLDRFSVQLLAAVDSLQKDGGG